MSKIIKVHKEADDVFLKLEDFADVVDISKVVYYEFSALDETNPSKGMNLKFFDKDEQELPLKEINHGPQ